ncbi:vacuolar ATPase assembly integral membrane protein VMA21 [Lentithecium fluviatile CBS 122367]|uniref:Vacuolar ATPase assembly integral membrane protein VMA21 n=1 Tax=Lentithecium fluviatile CBS 122367 TaxID=1168545 RepID=A0A6G1IUP3_9PLEO|nr:vacuolar ATPase assembly integral membrane protein VMA21 [Lentithecium fluviatile CBS 122367]
MTTRRIVSSEKTYLDHDGKGASEPSNIAPAVPSSVIWTLLSFTFAMFTLPIGTYYFTVKFVFAGNTTFAGGLAALMANVVLIAYVVMAMKDDQAEQKEEEEKKKKSL